jgi:hypothetical protein
MRRLLLLIVIISMLGFGCLDEKGYPGTKAEQITNTQSIDLDGDGSPDYLVYDFSPVAIQDANLKVQRQVTVAVETQAFYDTINPNLTDVDLLIGDQSMDEFSKSRTQSDTACSNSIGLMNVVCSDVVTCSRLCSSASVKCKRVASTYEDILAGSMISYVQDNNEIRSLILDARRMILNLRSAPQSDKDNFLNKSRQIVYKVASINSNPLYANPDLNLCEHSDFGMPYLIDAAGKIGNYSSANVSYRYRIILSAKPTTQQVSGNQIGVEVSGVTFTDKLPRQAVPTSDDISSMQSITAGQDALSTSVGWTSTKTVKDGYLLMYEFKSDQPPETVLPSLKTPDVKVKRINLTALIPTNYLFLTLFVMVKNYYIALGLALGLTLGFLLVIYNALVLLFTIVSEKAAGASLIAGFRRAFGRTDVRWKTDIVISIIFLGAGFYVSTFVAAQPTTLPSLMESLDFLLKTDMGLLGVGVVTIGMVMFYFTVDNFIKITILEKAYGMVIKQEKDMFLAKAATLKERIAQLAQVVEEYSREDFDVSKEYDVLTSMKAENIDALSKEMTGRTKALIEDGLNKVESATNGLKERKRIADENWMKWKDTITKTLDEQGEVYQSSLVTVPASLRTWALGRYARETAGEGVIMDRDILKKKKVSAESLVRDMITKGLLKGAVVIKQDKIAMAEFAEGSGTVTSVLALKLRAYLLSLAKNMGQHPPQSFVSIGETHVLVLMKGRNVESLLFINKPKFNEAVEQWKANSKALEGP